jgi:hypothetical protein
LSAREPPSAVPEPSVERKQQALRLRALPRKVVCRAQVAQGQVAPWVAWLLAVPTVPPAE